MEIPGLNKIIRGSRRLGLPVARTSLILMYHRIYDSACDPWSLCVSPKNFAEHLEVLQQWTTTLPLKSLVKSLQDKNLQHRAIAVSFDDGYADNLYIARPLLAKYGIPATVFITTGQLDSVREFWWDELERVLLQPRELPGDLRISINSTNFEWQLGGTAIYTKAELACSPTHPISGDAKGTRLDLYYAIWEQLLPMSQQSQYRVLDELFDWAGVDTAARESHRGLTVDEIDALVQHNLIELGAHTETHPYLSAHSSEFQSNEIYRSKYRLEEICGKPVNCFAYPYGNFTNKTVTLSRQAGFDFACTTVEDSIWRFTDPFRLPRLMVHNWNGDEFEKQLVSRLVVN